MRTAIVPYRAPAPPVAPADPVEVIDREARLFTALCAIATARRSILIARLQDKHNG